MTDLSDVELVRRMSGGDRAALGELYDRHAPVLNALALRILGDADDAEEVLQDAFLQAWRQADRFDATRGTPAAWLVTLARSRALDRRRRTRSARASLDAAASHAPPTGADLPAVGAAVRRLLDSLPAEQRRTLEMAYYDGLTQTEIAARTGDPLGTVKTRIRLGLGRLREALQVEVH